MFTQRLKDFKTDFDSKRVELEDDFQKEKIYAKASAKHEANVKRLIEDYHATVRGYETKQKEQELTNNGLREEIKALKDEITTKDARIEKLIDNHEAIIKELIESNREQVPNHKAIINESIESNHASQTKLKATINELIESNRERVANHRATIKELIENNYASQKKLKANYLESVSKIYCEINELKKGFKKLEDRLDNEQKLRQTLLENCDSLAEKFGEYRRNHPKVHDEDIEEQ